MATNQVTGYTSDLVERAIAGGYPSVLLRGDPSRRRDWLENYVDALVERDVMELGNIRKSGELSRMMNYAAVMAGQLLNVSRLASALDVDTTTASRWLGLLEHMFLIRLVPAWHGNRLKRLVKAPKLQFLDSGILAALQNTGKADIHSNRKVLGPILETFVYSELLKAVHVDSQSTNIYHFREKGGLEVDFVVERSFDQIVGIEVKASSTVHPRDFKGLARLKDDTGSSFRCGVILYDGDQIHQFKPDAYAVPFKVLWES